MAQMVSRRNDLIWTGWLERSVQPLVARSLRDMLRFCAVFALLVTMLPLGGCRNDEVVALPWADAKV